MNCVSGGGTHAAFWVDALQGRLDNQKAPAVLDGCCGGVDWPVSASYEQLMEIYPDAKVLLTEHPRGAEGWMKSMENTIHETMVVQSTFPVSWTLRWLPPAARFYSVIDQVRQLPELKGCLMGHTLDREKAKAAYVAHIDQVKRKVPAERLVIWNVSDGWEPLCKALGVRVPTEPFPNVNDTSEFR